AAEATVEAVGAFREHHRGGEAAGAVAEHPPELDQVAAAETAGDHRVEVTVGLERGRRTDIRQLDLRGVTPSFVQVRRAEVTVTVIQLNTYPPAGVGGGEVGTI